MDAVGSWAALRNRCLFELHLAGVYDESFGQKLDSYAAALAQHGGALRVVEQQIINRYAAALRENADGGVVFLKQFSNARYDVLRIPGDQRIGNATIQPALLQAANDGGEPTEAAQTAYAVEMLRQMIPDVMHAVGVEHERAVQTTLQEFFRDERVRSAGGRSPWTCLLLNPAGGHADVAFQASVHAAVGWFTEKVVAADASAVDGFESLLVRLDLARLGFFDPRRDALSPWSCVHHPSVPSTMLCALTDLESVPRLAERRRANTVHVYRHGFGEEAKVHMVSGEQRRNGFVRTKRLADEWLEGSFLLPPASPGAASNAKPFQVEPVLADAYAYRAGDSGHAQFSYYAAALFTITHSVLLGLHATSDGLRRLYGAVGAPMLGVAIASCECTLSVSMKANASMQTREFLASVGYSNSVLKSFVDCVSQSATEAVLLQARGVDDFVRYSFATGLSKASLLAKGSNAVREIEANTAVVVRGLDVEYLSLFADVLVLHGTYEFVYVRNANAAPTPNDTRLAEIATFSFAQPKLPAELRELVVSNKAFCRLLENAPGEPDTTHRAVVSLHAVAANTSANRQHVADAIDALFPERARDLLRPGSSFAPQIVDTGIAVWTPRRVHWWVDDVKPDTAAPHTPTPYAPSRLTASQLNAFNASIADYADAALPTTAMAKTFDYSSDVGLVLVKRLGTTLAGFLDGQQRTFADDGVVLGHETIDLDFIPADGRFVNNAFQDLYFPEVRTGGLLNGNANLTELRRQLAAFVDNVLLPGAKTNLHESRVAAMHYEASKDAVERIDELTNELYRIGLIEQKAVPQFALPASTQEAFASLRVVDGNSEVVRRTQSCVFNVVGCVRTLRSKELESSASVAAPVGLHSVFDALEAAGTLVEGACRFVNTMRSSRKRVLTSRSAGYKTRLADLNFRDMEMVVAAVGRYIDTLEQKFATRLARLRPSLRTRVAFVDAGFTGKSDFLAACKDAIDTLVAFKSAWFTGPVGVFLAIAAQLEDTTDATGGAALQPLFADSSAWIKELIGRLNAAELDFERLKMQVERDGPLGAWLDATEAGTARAGVALHKSAVAAMMSKCALGRDVRRRGETSARTAFAAAFDTTGATGGRDARAYKLNWMNVYADVYLDDGERARKDTALLEAAKLKSNTEAYNNADDGDLADDEKAQRARDKAALFGNTVNDDDEDEMEQDDDKEGENEYFGEEEYDQFMLVGGDDEHTGAVFVEQHDPRI